MYLVASTISAYAYNYMMEYETENQQTLCVEFLASAYKGISEYRRPTAIEVLKQGGIYISAKIMLDGAQSIMRQAMDASM